MNLGSLVSVATAAPANLVHFVCHNAKYEVNGAFPIPGGRDLDFCGFARAAGYPRVYQFAELTDLETGIEDVLSGDGPVFVNLVLEPGAFYPHDYVAVHSPDSRKTFRDALRSRL